MTIRVLIADDHPVYRSGLASVLADAGDIDVVGEAADSAAVLALAAERRPDVVLMDLHMPGVTGVEATRRLATEAPAVSVLVLTMFDDDESVLAAMRAGARGYLVKGAAGDRIVGAVRAVAAGEAVFGADVAGRVLGVFADDGRAGRAAQPFPTLTDREREILGMIAAGGPTPTSRAGSSCPTRPSATMCRTSSRSSRWPTGRRRSYGLGRPASGSARQAGDLPA